jgi:hypothetical protein
MQGLKREYLGAQTRLHAHANHQFKAEYEIVFENLRNTVRNDGRPVRELHRAVLRNLCVNAAGMMAWAHCRLTLQRIIIT